MGVPQGADHVIQDRSTLCQSLKTLLIQRASHQPNSDGEGRPEGLDDLVVGGVTYICVTAPP